MDVKCKNTVLSDAEKIKEQHWITLDVFGNQKLKKKIFHFKLTMDQINPKTSRNVCSLII